MKTVKQVSQVSGVSVRTLHHYDAIGLLPPTALTEAGYADSDEDCLTVTSGVFAAGDCRRKSVHQLTTAVADGSVAALAACAYIDECN